MPSNRTASFYIHVSLLASGLSAIILSSLAIVSHFLEPAKLASTYFAGDRPMSGICGDKTKVTKAVHILVRDLKDEKLPNSRLLHLKWKDDGSDVINTEDPPHPVKGNFGTSHDTDADLDLEQYLKKDGDLVLVVIQLPPGFVFAKGPEPLTTTAAANGDMFCPGEKFNSINATDTKRFYVKYTSGYVSGRIGSYWINYETKKTFPLFGTTTFVPHRADPNVKNGGG